MDAALAGWLHGLGGDLLAPFWVALNGPAAAGALGLLLLGWTAWRRAWRTLAVAAVAVALTDPLCARVLKPAFDRPRPCAVSPALAAPPALGCGSGAAMPSIHAANTAALAAAAASPPLAVLAALTGLGRVVVGAHWPTDVLAGWAVGATVGFGARRLSRRALGWT